MTPEFNSLQKTRYLWNHLWFLKTGNKVGVELEKAA